MQKNLNENLVYQNKNGVEYIQFKKLLEYPEIVHCYTLRSSNMLNFPPIYKDEQTLIKSYQKICNCLEVPPETVIKPHQTHTNNVERVEKIIELNEVDGMVTNHTKITLLTTSADCTSLLFYDPITKVVGNVHSGWRGTLQAIAEKAVKKMIKEYNCNPQNIICCICPCIKKCCFEVDEDVKKLFEEQYNYLENINTIIQKKKDLEKQSKYYIDTTKINIQLLKRIGLQEKNIIDSGICTKCHPEYFHSYRADKENSGRNAAIIGLK